MLVSTSRPKVNGRSDSCEKYWIVCGTPVFVQDEIVLGEIADDFALLVPHRGEHVHELYVDRNIGLLLVLAEKSGCWDSSKTHNKATAQSLTEGPDPAPD